MKNLFVLRELIQTSLYIIEHCWNESATQTVPVSFEQDVWGVKIRFFG